MKISIYRTAHFNAAHRLHNPHWSDEKNKEIYGVCNNPHFHGHNYDLEVRLTGEVDSETGYLFDLGKLSELIKIHIEDKFDHRNINVEIEEFKELIPSTENICFVIYNILRSKIDIKFDVGVKLWETPRNYVEYPVR